MDDLDGGESPRFWTAYVLLWVACGMIAVGLVFKVM